jgi:uncharacterized protein (DUF1778 family)
MRDVRLDRTFFSLTPRQTMALLADLEHPGVVAQDQASIEQLLAMPQPWHAISPALHRSTPGR